ncbi:Protein CBG21472 [Caenorhabditis briggsae]|uniref:Protein CBG21472 n=1 Tax=Caenorhabditis briggsae TaxID=6238 RepID=A8Y044_CAEBR|nr:Protein CBG21472 [Caenorhabditis briggsae]CAP38262.2 Protein CBG21472 [Caenorhabditis briggsae]
MLNKKRVRQRFRNRIAGELPNVRSEEEAKPILTIPSCSTVFNSSIDVNNQHSTNCKMPAKDDFAHSFELAPIKPRGEAFNFELSRDEIRSRNAGFRAVIVEKWMASLVEHRRVLVYTCSRTDGTSENAPWHDRQTGERPRWPRKSPRNEVGHYHCKSIAMAPNCLPIDKHCEKPQSSQSQEPKLKRASRDLPTPILSLVGASVAFMLIIFVGAFFYCRH